MVRITIATALFASLLHETPQGQDDLKAIQGDWLVVQIQTRGQDNLKKKPKKLIAKIAFKGDQIFMAGEPSGTIRLDASKTPRHLDWRDKDGTVKGIYKLDGDTLFICWGAPEDERPKEFRTRVDDPNGRLLTLQRAKEK